MNHVVLIGRLTKEAELKFLTTGNGVCTFTLAVDKRGKDGKREADFINCVAYGKTAENTANYTNKGSLIGVAGRINTRTYEAKDGTRKYITEVVADECQFLSKNLPSNFANSENCDEMQPVEDGDISFN